MSSYHFLADGREAAPTITGMNTLTLVSVGRLASLLGVGVATVKQAADRARVRPALTLNGIAHFHEADIGAIRRAALVRRRKPAEGTTK